MVEESETMEGENVIQYAQMLRSQFAPSVRISYLHGKMKAADKQKVMDDFSEGLIDVLVSTTVVEVGVNVPNATVMMVENAERFGLAQLHQLRGRVGRGVYQSYCIFMTSSKKKETMQRLEVLNKSNDSLADVVQADKIDILYGKDYFYEEILGLKFKISPFSFFQTNTLGAEVLYKTAREFVGETKDKVIFDLYSGTGTIAQMLAPVAKKVVGVEIVEEAVEAAKVNAKLNGLDNCEFIAGDVLKVVDELEDKPDFIVLDPPRDGIHPKAIQKIIDFGVEQMVYISCKPTSLARDLEVFEAAGYKVMRATAVDQFPNTVHIESMVLIQKDNI